MLAIIRNRKIYTTITLLVGIVVILDYFFVQSSLKLVSSSFISWAVQAAYFAIFIGLFNVYIFHVKRIQSRSREWIFSIYLLFITTLVLFIGLFLGTENLIYSFLFTNVYSIMGEAAYGLMVFYIGIASFRIMRMRSLEMVVLVLAAIFTLLYRAPIGSIIPYIPIIGKWIDNVINTGGMRGIMIGIALGTIGIGLRVLLGYERGAIQVE